MDNKENIISYNLQISQLVKSENVEDLTCLVCLGICFRPIILKCCEHLLCLNCAKQFVLKKSFCPYCKNTNLDFSFPSKLILRFFDNLIFYCPYKSNGCNEQIRYSSYFEHTTTCNKQDINSIKLNYCKKCFLLYNRNQEHSCETNIKNLDTIISDNDNNLLLNKLITLEKNQSSIVEKPLTVDGIQVPDSLNIKE